MIIVEIMVPSMDQAFDFELDEKANTKDILLEVQDILYKKTLSEDRNTKEDFILCNLDSHRILSYANTLSENGVKSGSKLLLL